MRSLVIYDSTYGNTRLIAQEIANTLRAEFEVMLLPVAEVREIPADVDLLVLGGPTHGHGMSLSMKRFLASLPEGAAHGARAATFDTRFHKPELLVGAASEVIARRLRKHGFVIAVEPASFFVTSAEGPLEAGELERARDWARELVASAAPVA